jgi:hypothetical protein
MPDETIQPPKKFQLPEGPNHVSVASYGKELYARYYQDLGDDNGAIAVHLGSTTIMFTPAQWSVVFAAVAAVSPRTVTV